MKTICIIIIRQAFITALLLLSVVLLFAQKNNTWKGGTPGHENDWNCPKNWSAYTVPDDFTNVFVPDVSSTSLATPVIRSGVVEINALFLESNALLTIEKDAQLVVFATVEGLSSSNIRINGSLLLLDELNDKTDGPELPLAGKMR